MLGSATSPHCVYRAYDVDGVLLYVGVSSNFKQRMYSHVKRFSSGSSWCHEDVQFLPRYVRDRQYAEALEVRAIRLLKPIYNRLHNYD